MVQWFTSLLFYEYNMRAMKKHYAIIISGPSGVGKGTIIRMIKEKHQIPVSVSHTTRKFREGEKEGIDYFFVTKDKFFELVDAGNFIEWEKVHDNYYGTHAINIETIEHTNLLFEVDVKGALRLMQRIKDVGSNYISVFLDAPSTDDLINRLKFRGSETEESIQLRMQTAKKEFSQKKHFDYVVVNDTISSAFLKIEEILKHKGVLQDEA